MDKLDTLSDIQDNHWYNTSDLNPTTNQIIYGSDTLKHKNYLKVFLRTKVLKLDERM